MESAICDCGNNSLPEQKIPMHPDDFSALMAWVIAKRFHESGTGRSFTEKPVWFSLVG